MEFRVTQAFSFNDGMKRKTICLLVMAVLIQPSSAIITRAGFIDFLYDMDPDEMALFVSELISRLDAAVDPSTIFSPSIILSTTINFNSGRRMMVILAFWNRPTCNLGRGGELRHPIRSVSGSTLRSIIFNTVVPVIESLIYHYLGYGFAIHENVSVFYFPANYWLDQPSDNDPESHQHDTIESDIDSFENFCNKTVNSDALGKGSVPPTSSNSSYNGTSFVPLSSSNVSRVFRSDNFTKAGTHRAIAADHNASNTNNGTMATNEKFPVDQNGDCDLPSLVLVFALGPSFDDQNSHGVQILNPTDKIWSPNARFALVMQTDCNLVLYDYVAQTSLWASGTEDMGSVCYATLTMYGELIVYDTDIDNILFRTNTWCTGNGGICWTNTILEVQDDGNLVLYFAETGVALWASNTVVCEGGCS